MAPEATLVKAAYSETRGAMETTVQAVSAEPEVAAEARVPELPALRVWSVSITESVRLAATPVALAMAAMAAQVAQVVQQSMAPRALTELEV